MLDDRSLFGADLRTFGDKFQLNTKILMDITKVPVKFWLHNRNSMKEKWLLDAVNSVSVAESEITIRSMNIMHETEQKCQPGIYN